MHVLYLMQLDNRNGCALCIYTITFLLLIFLLVFVYLFVLLPLSHPTHSLECTEYGADSIKTTYAANSGTSGSVPSSAPASSSSQPKSVYA